MKRKSAQDWVRQQGERGGTFWLNSKTGERKYQTENPGGEASQQEQGHDDKAKQWADQVIAKYGDKSGEFLEQSKAKYANDPAKLAAIEKVMALLKPTKTAPKEAEAEKPKHGMVPHANDPHRHIRYQDGKPVKIHDRHKDAEHVDDVLFDTSGRPGVLRDKDGNLLGIQIDPKSKSRLDSENNVGMVHRTTMHTDEVTKQYGTYAADLADQMADKVEDAASEGGSKEDIANRVDEARAEFSAHLGVAKNEAVEWLRKQFGQNKDHMADIEKEVGTLFDDIETKADEAFYYFDGADDGEAGFDDAESYAKDIRNEAKHVSDELARIAKDHQESIEEEYESARADHESEASDLVSSLDEYDPDDAEEAVKEFNDDAEKNDRAYKIVKDDDGWTYEERSLKRSVTKTLMRSPFRKKGFSGLDKNGHLWVNGRQVKQGGASRPASAPRSTGGGGHRYYTAPKRSTPKGGLGPLQQRAELIADILGGIYGDRALSMVEGEPGNKSLAGSPLFRSPFRKSLYLILKAWDALAHPRGANGRFIPKGSAEAVSTAKEAVKRTLKEKPSSETAKKLADHLSILTVKQLHELKREYNLSASGETRAKLVEKIAERLGKGRAGVDDSPAMTMDSPKFADMLKAEALKLESFVGRKPGEDAAHKVFISDLYDAVKDKIGNPSLDEFKKRLGKMLQSGDVELSRADLVGGMGLEKDAEKRKRSETYHPMKTPDPLRVGTDADAHYFTVDPKAGAKPKEEPKIPTYSEWAKGEREKNRRIPTPFGKKEEPAQQAEADKPKPKRGKPKFQTLLSEVISQGGLNLDKVKEQYNVKREFLEHGLGRAFERHFTEGSHKRSRGMGLDQMAQLLEENGHIRVPPNRNPDDYLLELLQSHAKSLNADYDSGIEREQAKYYKELENARKHADQSEIEETLRSGEEAGRAEGKAAALAGDFGSMADEEGAFGEVGDFEFGANAGTEEGIASTPNRAASQDADIDPAKMTRKQYGDYLKREDMSVKNKDVLRQKHDEAILSRLFEKEIKDDNFARGINGEFQDLRQGIQRNGMKRDIQDVGAFKHVDRKIASLYERAIAAGKPIPPEVLADYPELAKNPATSPAPASTPKGQDSGKATVEKQDQAKEPPAVTRHSLDIPKDKMFAAGIKRSPFWVPSISMGALKGENAIWHNQGHPDQVRFNAAHDGGDYAKTKAAEIEAAIRAGYKLQNYRAGKYGTLWVYEKDGKVLTERGARALADGSGVVNIPKGTTRETAKSAIDTFSKFVESLPESTKSNFSALVAAVNRSPLGDHVSLKRGDDGKIRLESKTGEWRIYEPENGSDAAGNWHRDIGSSLPRFLEKISHMASNSIPDEDHGWVTHDRSANVSAVAKHPPIGATPTPSANPIPSPFSKKEKIPKS